MKVAMVTGLYPKDADRVDGGVAGAVKYLVDELRKLPGVEVVVVLPKQKVAAVTRDERGGVAVYSLPKLAAWKWLPATIYDLVAGRRQLHDQLLELGVDLVHFQGVTFLAAAYPGPSVLTIHGIVEQDAKFNRTWGPFWRIKVLVLELTERWGRRRVPHLILISDYVRRFLPETGGPSRLWRIDNAIADSFFDVPRRPERGRVLCCSRVQPRKNILGLIEGFAAAAKDMPEARLRIAGAADDEYLAKCKALVARLGVGEKVAFLGNLNFAQIQDELSRCACSALPSFQETAPLAIEEAMAARVPMVASPVGGVADMVRDGETGFLVDPYDAPAIGRALETLLKDDARAARMGERARELAENSYRASSVARLTHDCYREVLARPRAVRRSRRLEDALLAAGWRFPLSRSLASREPVVLMYHGVAASDPCADELDAETFERQLVFLKDAFELVPVDRLGRRRSALAPVQAVLTFDDGFRNNAEVAAPILRKHGVPAAFFLSSRHAETGKYLWFKHLRLLERFYPGDSLTFRGERYDLADARRRGELARLSSRLLALRPHAAAMYEALEKELPSLESFMTPGAIAAHGAGMTAGHAAELAREQLFSFGVHTVDHPDLTLCDSAEVRRQIAENRDWIAKATGRAVGSIAYPLGAYDRRVLDTVRELGFSTGYCVGRSQAAAGAPADPVLAAPRVGIYSPSLDKLAFKAHWGNLLRRTPMRMG